MKFICSKNELLENILIVSRAVSSKSAVKILSCILVAANEFGLKLMGNDLELGIETSYFKAEVLTPGLIALEAKMFQEIVRKMPDGNIEITVDDNKEVLICCGKTEFKILGYPGEEFTFVKLLEKEKPTIINTENLKKMIKQTSFAIAQKDSSKPVFTGLLIEINDSSITSVGVDGVRIALKRIKTEITQEDRSVIVPGRIINEISKILPDDDEECSIYVNENHAMFLFSKFSVVTPLLFGEFIKYEQAFPDTFKTEIRISKSGLLTCLERTILLYDETKKIPVVLSINDEVCTVTSNSQNGMVTDEVGIEFSGEPLEISFNPRYIIDVLRVIEEETVIIRFNSPNSACSIFGLDNDSYKFLILPLRRRT